MALIPLPVETIEAVNQQEGKPFPYTRFGESAPVVGELAAMAMPESAESQRMMQLEQMLQEAQGRTEIIEREAYDKAYAAGEKAGMVLGEKRAEQILETLQQCLDQAELQVQQLSQQSADAVLDIAQSITEHLIGDLLAEQGDILFKAAQRAAEQLPNMKSLRLAVHPDDIEAFKRLMQEQKSDWRLHADINMLSGSCRLMSDHQDTLIHPMQAIEEAVQHIRSELQNVNFQKDQKDE